MSNVFGAPRNPYTLVMEMVNGTNNLCVFLVMERVNALDGTINYINTVFSLKPVREFLG